MPLAGLGLGTCAQVVPFHRSIKVWIAVPLAKKPTAQALAAEVAATPDRALVIEPGLGLATFFHEDPFHRSISVCCDAAAELPPTAPAVPAPAPITTAAAITASTARKPRPEINLLITYSPPVTPRPRSVQCPPARGLKSIPVYCRPF